MHIEVLDGSGVGTRAIARLPKPDDSRKAKTGLELAGTNRLQGREFRYRAIVSRDRTTLEALEPKTTLLADGTKLELAGRYDDLSEKTRALSAKAAFDPIDKELNAVYGKLTATLDPAGQEELRTEQRRWLKYRDVTSYDGDNSNLIGPGTAPHFRQQGRRTHERIEFLKVLLARPAQPGAGHTLYAAGRGGSFAVGRVDAAVFFAAMIGYPKLNSADASSDLPCELSGLARAAGGNSWFAKAEDLGADAAKFKDKSRYVILFEKGAGLHVHLNVMLKTPQPDYSFTLEWDGFGFAVERNASITLEKPAF